MRNKIMVVFASLAMLAMVGCAPKQPDLLRVTGPYSDSSVERCLMFWTANYSTNVVNHYYAGSCHPRYPFNDAFIYWKEERTLLDYHEPALCYDAPPPSPGGEIFAFHHQLKLDQDTVDTGDDIGGSTYRVTHRQWLDWMEPCLAKGKEYVITLEAARKLFPPRTAEHKTAQAQATVQVRGEVKNADQKLPWKKDMTAWDAIDEAGGATFYAADGVAVWRDGHKILKSKLFGSRYSKLLPDDVVIVFKE
jgi:hypothetical protein